MNDFALRRIQSIALTAVVAMTVAAAPSPVLAHDDDDDGPTVRAAPSVAQLFTYDSQRDTAYLGVQLEEETEHAEGGARVTEVVEDSPADEGGLREGDIIVRFDDKTIRGPVALTSKLHEREPGDVVPVVVQRDGKEQSLSIELGRRSDMWRVLTAPEGTTLLQTEPGGLGFSYGCDDGDCQLFGIGTSGRPRLGVQLVETTPELRRHLGGSDSEGVLVSKVLVGTPAHSAGIEVGDLILTVDGSSVRNSAELRRELVDKLGRDFNIEVVRAGKRLPIQVAIPEAETDRPTGPRA